MVSTNLLSDTQFTNLIINVSGKESGKTGLKNMKYAKYVVLL